jgi:glycosyltransferase involved in cell wall biosynthesis
LLPDYIYELSAEQTSRGHSVDVVTWKRNGGFSEERVLEGFVIHRLPGLNLGIRGAIHEYPYIPGLSATIEKLKPDVVHAESHLFLTSVQAVRKARKLGLPCVVTVHGVFAERGFAVNSAQLAYLRTLGLEVFKNADVVVCLTRSDVEQVVRLGCSLKKVRLIPNAVDTELFSPSGERESSLVVWVGRFVPEKGVEYLIEAARLVVDEFKDVRFLLVGYGPLKAKMMRLVHERGLDGFVWFVGPLSRDEVAGVLGRAAVFVLPSLSEGMPLALLEAMSCGNAVVASNIGGIAEIVRDYDNGVLVSPRNVEELASSILSLLCDDGLRGKVARNAREAVEKEHSWASVLAQLDSVYESIKV